MKTVVVGSKEICLGFRLAGIKEFVYRENVGNMSQLIEDMLKREDVGIIIMDSGSYSMLDWALKKRLETIAKPSIITVPDYGSNKMETESLDVLVKRALGFDLRKK